MKKKAINLAQTPMTVKRVLFAFLFFSVWAAPNVGASSLSADEKVSEEQVFQDGKKIAIRGTVVDSNKEPLIGVSVKVVGASLGTVTDIDGNFNLSVPSTNSDLEFTYVGYTSQTVKVGSNTFLNVTLEDNSHELSTVVVTALGIKRDKKALGYSVSSISGDDLTTGGTPVNAVSSLYGKASGLQIGATSGGPTGGMNIKIRNSVSLNENSNTRPLIVVDGIPIQDKNTANDQRSIEGGGDRGTGINDINADDIASIEVLKGAKAAVLYGSEGANGVLLITTKSGSSKKGLGIDFNANYAVIKAAYSPEFQNEYGTGSSAGIGLLQNVSKDGFYMTKNAQGEYVESYWNNKSASFGPKMDGRSLLWWDGTNKSYSPQKDNFKDLYRTGSQTAVNLAISNSGDMGSFRVGYNFRDYQSIALGASNYSHGFTFNGDLKANDFVKIKASTSFTQNRDKNAPFRIQDLTTYGVGRDTDVKYMKSIYKNAAGYSTFDDPSVASMFPGGGAIGEYLWSQKEDLNDYKRNHLIQSLSMDVKFNDNISWTSLGGLDYTIIENEVQGTFKRPMSENKLQGFYGLTSNREATYYAQSTLNFDYDLSSKWNLLAFIGGAVKRNVMDSQKTYIKEEFSVENYFSFSNTTNPNGAKSERVRGKDLLLSTFASAQLSYDNQVYAEVTGRNDWSSILPSDNNSYFYPGVSLSWILSETFRNDLPAAISFLKLRSSWADVGRPGPRYYGNVSFKLGNYGGYPTLSMPTYLPPANFSVEGAGFPKASLKPERKREFELGFESAFLPQNRISVDFSWFTGNTYNQIVTLPVPASSGVNEVRLNAGNIAQSGLELSINTKPVITKDLLWTLGVNFANYTTKIKELDKGIDQQILWGGSDGATIMAPVNGQFGEIWVRPYEVDEKTGQRIVNGNGVWVLDETKWKKVGKTTPDVVGGLNTAITYKAFTLTANFDFQFGGTLISQTNMYLLGNGTGKASLKYRDEANGGLPYYMRKDGTSVLLDSHTAAVPSDSYYSFILHDGVIVPGVDANGKTNTKVIPAETYYSSTYWQSGTAMSEDVIYKSDYFAFRELSLSYQLPKSLLNKAKIQAARLTLFANNLAYIYKDVPNTTPESNMGTNSFAEFNITPSTRSFGIGINMSF